MNDYGYVCGNLCNIQVLEKGNGIFKSPKTDKRYKRQDWVHSYSQVFFQKELHCKQHG